MTHQDHGSYGDMGGYGEDTANGDPDGTTVTAHAQESGDRHGRRVPTPRQRRRKRWRIVRRTLYALFGIFFVLPAIAFTIAYFVIDVPAPDQVASGQNQVITYYYSDGSVMGEVAPPGGGNRVILEPHQIPELVKHAAYAAEDATFETNPGFDVTGIVRAAWNQATGGSGGGSTISQQYIKQATGNDEHSYVRKFVEVVKAFKMNNNQSKTEIITAYLNTIYLGRGAYGVQTAAQAYFGKDIGELNPSEAALLGGMIQQPSRFEEPAYMKQRWKYVLGQMEANGWISAKQLQQAEFPELVPEEESGAQGISGSMNYLEQRVNDELAAKGYPKKKLQSGGYQIYTTIDPRAQKLAKQAVTSVMEGQPEKLEESLVAVDPNTGAVRAYYGGPYNENNKRDAASTLRNPGSSFKPFDLVALLQQDKGLAQTYDGTDSQEIAGALRHNSSQRASCSQNCTVARAMEVSANTVFFNMLVNDLSIDQVIDAAHSAGIPVDTMGKGDANIAIGGGKTQVSPTHMAAAYATFASGGMRHDTHFVTKLESSDGDLVYETKTEGEPAFAAQNPELSKKIAGNVTKSLEPVLPHSNLRCRSGYDCAGKTGTHEAKDSRSQNAQAWMVGYSPAISAAAWVGTYEGPKVPIKNAQGRPIYGSGLPGEIWQKFMRSYLEGTPKLRFPDVDTIGEKLDRSDSDDGNGNGRRGDDEDDDEDDRGDTTTTTTRSRPDHPTESSETTTSRPSFTIDDPNPGNGNDGDDDGDLFNPNPGDSSARGG